MSISTANRPHSGRINVHESGDYPIVLGDSLKDEDSPDSQVLRLRYNWEPRQGFSGHKGTLKRSNGQVKLVYEDAALGSSTYDYVATAPSDDDTDTDNGITRLALVFDEKKSAYVLEQISHSLDLNLAAAHDQSKAEVQQHRRINDRTSQANRPKNPAEKNEEEAEPGNPFDFRNFLSEAKENAEKAAQPTGGRTPIPGSRTPVSGVSSPSLVPGRFLSSNTPQFRPTPTSAPLPRKPTSAKPAATTSTRKQPTNKRKPVLAKPSAPQPLSNEVVSDSSEDDTQTKTTIPQPSATQNRGKGHNRNVSSISLARSPHIVVNDGALEIDMGSPSPELRPRATIDIEAFRSGTNTPTIGFRSNKLSPPRLHRDVEMKDGSEDEEDDEDRYDFNGNENEYMDEDIEDFALGSPQSKKIEDRKDEIIEDAPSPPTPLPPPAEDDEDDLLEAELYAALNNAQEDDESEVSEEE